MDDKTTPLERYVRILEAIAASGGRATAGDLVTILDLPRPTVHRLLRSLLDTQLIEKLSENRYGIAERMQRMSLLAADDRWFEPVLRPIVVEAAEAFNMTTYVGRYDGRNVVSIMMESPEEPWRAYVLPGREFAPHAAAGAKAILAFQPQKTVELQLREQRLPRFTPKTLVSVEDVLDDYVEVRRRQYGSCLGEIDESINALAVPVMAHRQVVMSIGITAPVATLPAAQLAAFAERLQPYARRVTALLEARN